MSLRVALLGNSFARHAQLPALRWARENGAPHEVAALAGHDLEKARATAAEWGIPTVTDDWTTLFASGATPFDLVIVSTPTDLHAPMVGAALESGAAVLCEKPFALDGNEARELTALAKGKLALIDHQTRWSPWRRAFKDAIAEGIVGAPWAGRVQMRIASLPRLGAPMTWWYEEVRGGGILGALGSHMLDGVMDQFGRHFEEVTARLTTVIQERPTAEGNSVPVSADEEAWLHCVMDDGLPLTVETSIVAFGCERDAGGGNLLELRGSAGTLRLEERPRWSSRPMAKLPGSSPSSRSRPAASTAWARAACSPAAFRRTYATCSSPSVKGGPSWKARPASRALCT